MDLQQVFRESQEQLVAAQKGEFYSKIVFTVKDKMLQKIIDNFNEIDALRDE